MSDLWKSESFQEYYAGCTLADLKDVLQRLDAEQYPERYGVVCAEIVRRTALSYDPIAKARREAVQVQRPSWLTRWSSAVLAAFSFSTEPVLPSSAAGWKRKVPLATVSGAIVGALMTVVLISIPCAIITVLCIAEGLPVVDGAATLRVIGAFILVGSVLVPLGAAAGLALEICRNVLSAVRSYFLGDEG